MDIKGVQVISAGSWVYVMDEKDLKEESPVSVSVNRTSIMLVKKSGKIYAVSNKCAHMECPLSRGTLDGYTIKCPCHDWIFDIRTGEFLVAKEIKIPVFRCMVSNQKIMIDMEGVKL
ncbi:Rieske (2Fe-2S) iron-sulfur domain protein [Methanosalsum zhilinae DSM 4017]|uniref:Rieske (2Fe-2S) iron-sulfur domain protein n=1 Tax=Methanosalsum zhilinae (strain DSM 4017 / NBRC 107636 / OCM 62 / WeN5) TaxID=679901 RepID=F7XKT4_METZD|nr:Rieske (2Fe-2S) protein [Methanosalsum zhilinae]AEH61797.1 Rieske (2Fe-2S) iron-sulfur domain protein [Methanosalsum zhilinae DSM 4017]